MLTNQAINPGFTNLVRWQNHWHVVRQSWSFFQNDFAGRIANRVMQTGPSLRESVVSGINAVWYILVYGTIALGLLARARCAARGAGDAVVRSPMPRPCGISCRACACAAAMSEARSTLTGRVVDSYTNILTVKLFADPQGRGRSSCANRSTTHTDTFRAPASLHHRLRPDARDARTPR